MLETYFSATKMLGHLRSGPSGPYLDGFAEALERQGYGPETAVRYLRAAAHIGHVMTEQCAGLTDIDLAAFDEHLRTCRCPRAKGGRRNHHTTYGARLYRRHLIELGVCRSAAEVAAPAEPKLVADFKTWLRKHRGASDATVRLYARDAAGLMTELGSDPAGLEAERRPRLLPGRREQVRARHDREDDDEPAGLPAVPRSRRPLPSRSRRHRSGLRPLAACRHAPVSVDRAGLPADCCL